MKQKNNIQSSKIELAKLILNIESPDLIYKIKKLVLKETSDFWLSLTDSEKEEIALGINQLNKGQRISVEEFMKKVS